MSTLSLSTDEGLLASILAAETFHIVINDDNAIESRGSSLVSLHPGTASALVPDQLLKCLRPVGMSITFDELRRSAGKYLILDYVPAGLKLRGQFVLDKAGRRGVFLGAPWFQKASEFAAYGLSMESLPGHYGLIEALFIMQTNEAALGDFRRLSEQLRQQQQELKLAEQQARTASEVKSRFLANMSHEIRTPLHGMLGLNRLLMETELSAEQREYLEMAMLSGETLLHLVDDVLDLSRLEAGRLPLSNEPFRVSELLAKVQKLFSLRADDADLRIEIVSELPGNDSYVGDDRRITQVLGNLISNAIKFSSRGGTVRVKTFEGQSVAGHTDLHFAVSDNGIGISEAALAYIFNPFTQADDSTTRRFGGSGLGLSICKQLVELMHGQIWATSKEGVGSTFHFRVRVEVSDSRPSIAPAAAPIRPVTRHPQVAETEAPVLEVLLVEDNIVSQKIATAFLRKAGFAVQVAMNGAEALDILRTQRERFMAVLMDCQMPVMSGFEAARAIRAIEQSEPALGRLRIIAMTANAMQGDRERCLEAGMDDYLAKPVDPTRLAAILNAG